jgi:glutathione synthase
MPKATLTLAFVMDPPATMNPDADTTFAFMLEARARGHRTLYVDPADLGVDHHRVRARVTPITVSRGRSPCFELGEPRVVHLDEEVDVAFQRKDPPVDVDYVVATQILALCRRTLVLNRPEGILVANEKLYAMHFSELMAETIVTRHIPELVEFMHKMGGEMVVKPLDGRGGEGIFLVGESDRNRNSILEQSTRFGTRRVMAQRFLAEVARGDKRILLLEGEPLGALLRIPSERELRANLHVGGTAVRTDIGPEDRRIIERIGPRLREDGLFFVGIDVIDGQLTEINVTSPTGIQEMGRLDGAVYEKRVLDRVEALAAEAGTVLSS